MKKNKSYKKGTAGAMMSPGYIAFHEGSTIHEAIERLRAISPDSNKAFYIYITNGEGTLVGVIQVRDLIIKPAQTQLGEIMRRDIKYIEAATDREEVARVFSISNLLAMPVVDKERRLLGVITADDVVNMVEAEATEDILKLGGIVSGEESRDMTTREVVRRRLPWLSFNMFLDLLAASVIAAFQNTIQQAVAIAVLLPIISDMGGNTGFQAISVSMRELVLGNIRSSDYRKVLFKELSVSFLNGVVLGAGIGVIAYFWKRMPMLGVVAGLALWINTIVAAIVGGIMPLLLRKLKIDPAIASGPILTTITDITGFFIILSLATKFVHYLV